VRFVFTTRPERRVLRYFERLKPYTLAAESQMNLDDIRQYIENRVGKEKMQARLQLAEVEPQTFVNRLSELSTGNFLYTKILLNDIEAGRQSLDDLSALPQSIDEIYHGFLKRFTVTEWEEHYQPILGVLAVAQEPITEVQLAHFTGIGQGKIRQNLGVVRQFLDISDDGHGRETFTVFHQSLRDYLLNEERNIDFWCEAKEQHQRLVDYYMADDQSWQTKPTSDRYLWHHLAYHLSGASKNSELRALLFNFDWLQAKLDATDANALITDYDFLPDALGLPLVQSAIQLSAHILVQDKKQLAGQLLGRLLSYEVPEIQTMLEQAKQWKAVPWLRPLTPSLRSPGEPLHRTLTGHNKSVLAVAVTLDGERIISASEDKTLKVWNFKSGALLRTLVGHDKAVTAVAVIPHQNEQLIISASKDGTLKVWNLENGEVLQTLVGHNESVNAVAVTPDGQLAISASDDTTLKVWNLKSKAQLLTLNNHKASVTTVAIMPDGQHFISGSKDKTLKVWNLETGEELFTLQNSIDEVTAVAVAPDGKQVISNIDKRSLRVWDLNYKEGIRHLNGHVFTVTAVAVTPDGQHAVSASEDKTIRVWDLNKWMNRLTLRDHTGRVRAIAVTPDGGYAISASDDTTLKVWSLENNAEFYASTGHTNTVSAVAVTPDGQSAISASWDRTLRVWNLNTGAELGTLQGHLMAIHAVVVMPDGQRAISASQDCTLKVWDLERTRELYTLHGHTLPVIAVAVTPDGKRAISSSNYQFTGLLSSDKPLRMWSLESKEQLSIPENLTDCINAILETHEGLYIPRTESGGCPTGSITSLAVMPDGKRIVLATDSLTYPVLKVYEIQSGAELHTLRGHTLPVSAVAVMSDGLHLVSASFDHDLIIWNLENEVKPKKLHGHTDFVNAVAVTTDGQRAISASKDTTLKVWDLVNEKVITTFSGDSALKSCAVAPDGMTIIGGEESGRVHFLRFEGV
jgi:WD40 repeat protein